MGPKSDNPRSENSESFQDFSFLEIILPEEAPEIDPEPTTEEIVGVIEAMSRVFQAVKEAIKSVFEKVGAFLRAFAEAPVETMLRSVATPREWHLYHHAKKGRTRKKYRNRLMRRVRRIMEAIP